MLEGFSAQSWLSWYANSTRAPPNRWDRESFETAHNHVFYVKECTRPMSGRSEGEDRMHGAYHTFGNAGWHTKEIWLQRRSIKLGHGRAATPPSNIPE
ncbi:hypothetical protein MGYG_07739 [Nannizzia gypsea CBS 118893]|uniref:Uncharacterized protein n=1 Tax=Arthroderma gypseum (strain ATCC MYA-4604 / CBS 118893) TaxID=535722 RepID=E4V407_ARTGP|nr:hypothetical protein MGYG_07739 [Nannizzia gypsea CBS 118893]EFR04731.1 hypothetical protein MGYG_07739 [Nannizzia gypsea CBS 118893]